MAYFSAKPRPTGCGITGAALTGAALLVASLSLLPRPANACDRDCADAIDALSNAARKAPQSVVRGRNTTVVVQYGAGVPVLKCRPLNFCSLQLQPGEVPIEDIALGDSVLWTAQVRVSGSAEQPHVRIVIKPDANATQTSLLVATNKRFYDVQLLKSETEYTHTLAFTYPREVAAANLAQIARLKAAKKGSHRRKTAARAKKSLTVGKSTVHVSALNFGYTISGRTRFKPARIFHDSRKTYIDLPDTYSGEKPVFLAAGASRDKEIVNSRWRGNRLTIDRVVDAGSLVLGVGGRAQKINIKRKPTK